MIDYEGSDGDICIKSVLVADSKPKDAIYVPHDFIIARTARRQVTDYVAASRPMPKTN